jgi:hypothetical protein
MVYTPVNQQVITINSHMRMECIDIMKDNDRKESNYMDEDSGME